MRRTRKTRKRRNRRTDKFGRQPSTSRKRKADIKARRNRKTVAATEAQKEKTLQRRWGVAISEARKESRAVIDDFAKTMAKLNLGNFSVGEVSKNFSKIKIKSPKRSSIKKFTKGGRRRRTRRRN